MDKPGKVGVYYMKKYFVAGLVILLPFALTIAILVFIFNFLTVPFTGIVKSIFDHYQIFDNGFFVFTTDHMQQIISQTLILLFLFFSTVGLGVVAHFFFMPQLATFGEAIVSRIPIVNTIYRTSKDVVKTMFHSSSKSFKQVVLVPFPTKEVYSVGLITQENLPNPNEGPSAYIAVFVPTTPNPTSGFLMMFKPEEIQYLDMKVEDAFKFVVSCGVVPMPFKIISREEAFAKSKKPEPETCTL